MGEQTQGADKPVDMREYMARTIDEIDESIAEWSETRNHLALRLAVIDAAEDPELQRIADEVQECIDSGQGFPDARPADEVLAEAHRRYVTR